MHSLEINHEALLRENVDLKLKVKEQTDKVKVFKAKVQKYQTTYHDIDIGELHRKLQYLESECDVMTRLNTRLTQHIETISKNNDVFRKKLKQHKERERREKEIAEQAVRD